jgi:hypothetical protein
MESGRFIASKSNREKHSAPQGSLRGPSGAVLAASRIGDASPRIATHYDKLVRNCFYVEFLHWPANCESTGSEPRNVQHNSASNGRIQVGEQACSIFDLHRSIDRLMMPENALAETSSGALPDIPAVGGWREGAARAIVAPEVSAPRVYGLAHEVARGVQCVRSRPALHIANECD